MLFIITDTNGKIQDIATRKENLARGYAFPNNKILELSESDIRIGDTYKDGHLTRNNENRLKIAQLQSNEAKITDKIRADAVTALKATGDLPADFES